MSISKLELQIKTLPENPGIYKFYNSEDIIIYIGKAINLKKRVNSYFNKNHTHFRTKLLVKQIVKVENIVVETEMDALLLENNLIKKFKPKFNVLLKDDKTYPWICIQKKPIPKIFYTRKIEKNKGEYFGPFTNVKSVKFLIKLIKNVYPFLNHELIHLLKKEGEKITVQETEKYLHDIKLMIKGNFKSSIEGFRAEMERLSILTEFEKAQKIKEKLEILYNYQVKSTIVNPRISDVDVFSIFSDDAFSYVNFMQISFGAIISSYTIEIKKNLNESDQEILRVSIVELRQRFNSKSNNIIIPFNLNLGSKIKCLIPKVGDKKKLVDLSLRNAKSFRMERFKQIKILDPERHIDRLLFQMKTDLRLKKIPYHIECFDNSNLQGNEPVAACVVFKNCKPAKKEYRHYNIKTVSGPDDFASMEEVVYRRYNRLILEKSPLPQLIIVDGGKGQLTSALKSIDRLNLRGQVAVIGIAKRLEEIFYPGDSIPLYLDKKSETLKIIQQLRNEAHRFGIKLHRNKRSKSALSSNLDKINGIGVKTQIKLIKKFKSFNNIKMASKKELTDAVGISKATKLYKQIHLD
ncbi:MAG: excinuclease ABC subunit C [Flavobacteriaceae bacterium]|nr:excinuclease ABC subunit C [Flavobacteriaceae bacterium]